MRTKPILPTLRLLTASLAIALAGTYGARAHPYASGISGTNGAGQVSFTMNEGGAAVVVTFDDNSTLDMGVLPEGPTNFTLAPHTSFRITCTKQGTGSPTLISSDTFSNSVWSNACGFAVNKSAKNGALFGRLYAGVYATYTGTGAKQQGIYAMNADQTLAASWIGNPTPYVWSQNSLGNVSSNFKGPGRMRVAPDGSLLVADGLGAGNANMVYMFSPDLSSVQPLLGPSTATVFGDIFGTPCAVGSLAAGNLKLYVPSAGTPTPADTNCIYGPLTFQGSFNCVQVYNIGSGPLPWNKRPDYSYTVGLDGIATLRPEVDVEPNGNVVCGFGRANLSNPNLQILRPILTTNGITGDYANKIIADAAKDQTNWLYTSGVTPPFNSPPSVDPWNGSSVPGNGITGTYGGVRVSPDQLFLASLDNDNGITYALLDNNGLPIDGTISAIVNATSSGFQSGIDWDAADNLWTITRSGLPTNTGQSKLRCYSMGLSTTCISSNDWTGTNGSFSFVIPGARATLAATTPNASQNYTNNVTNPGAPIPGVFTIGLFNGNGTPTPGPTTVSFTRGGTAVYGVNYTINTNETPGGVIINSNSVIFPAGIGAGNTVTVGVKIIPTATPVSGPTLTVTARLNSGTNFTAIAPLNGAVAIRNTGPQVLQLAAPSPGTLNGMNRGVPSDQARFIITRVGDTNGPGNDALSVTPKTLTVTNINYCAASGLGLATLGVDYTAGPQNFTGSLPVNSSGAAITIAPGATNIVCMIGNPVQHLNTSITRSNLAVVINLTNVCDTVGTPGCNTNCSSLEGLPYQVTVTTQTLNEFDNANGGEVVLWSNPLTNSFDSTNWTLVYASINQDCSPKLPTVISNYDNSTDPQAGAYVVKFGKSVNDPGNDGGIAVPPSQTMTANGWSTALKMTVNKDPTQAGEAGINLYPQIPGLPWSNHMVFNGNYALRFDMYLSLYDFALNNPTIGTVAREFAAFGINHQGTNANWRLDINPRAAGNGAFPINADGEWCSIGAGSGSVTPADYDMFISPAWAVTDPTTGVPLVQTIPYTTNTITIAPYTNAYDQCFGAGYNGVTNVFANSGVPNDQQSANNNAPVTGPSPQQGVIKNPPFVGINTRGGAPDNAWIDVSLEVQRQTNLVLKVAQQEIFRSSTLLPIFGTQNPLAPFGGTPMLGYLDPHIDVSDYSAFVYFSNMRIVELSPFIPWTNQPVAGLIVTQGADFTLTSGAMYASNPLTNIWNRGTTNGLPTIGNRESFTATVALSTNAFAATSGIDTLTVTNIQSGTNYASTWSDQAGSINTYRAVVEVVAGPGDQTVAAGSTATFSVVPSGNAPPSFQWKTNGVNLANNTHYSGVTTATLRITNVQSADALTYTCVATDAYGSVSPAGVLTVNAAAPINAVVAPATRTNVWGSSASFTVTASGSQPFTYQWKVNGVDLTESAHYIGTTSSALTIAGVTGADAATYSAGVTNGLGGTFSSGGVLAISVPPPTLRKVALAGGNLTLNFTSSNLFDTTNAFSLLTSVPVQGPYTNMPATVVTNNGASGTYEIVIPQPVEPSRFFRLQHAN